MTATNIQSEVHAALLEATTDTGQGELTVTIHRPGAIDESTSPPTMGTAQDYSFRAVQSKLSFMDMQGGNTRATDTKLMLSVADHGIEPQNGDKITVGGQRMAIQSVAPVSPGGVTLMWTVIARGGN